MCMSSPTIMAPAEEEKKAKLMRNDYLDNERSRIRMQDAIRGTNDGLYMAGSDVGLGFGERSAATLPSGVTPYDRSKGQAYSTSVGGGGSNDELTYQDWLSQQGNDLGADEWESAV